MRRFILPITLLLSVAACGDAIEDNHFADDIREERKATPAVTNEAVPVRIGELGPNFPACNAAGVTRNLEAGQVIPVRSAPFDTAPETGQLPAGGRFFICSRSHDQKWFGIVFGGDLVACGLSRPVMTRQAYPGPCGSGWVSSPFVKFTAGAEQVVQPTDPQAE